MRRREFISRTSGAAMWPLAMQARQPERQCLADALGLRLL
jgi:hypothetical protein